MVKQNLRELVLVTSSSSCPLHPLLTYKPCTCRQCQPHLLLSGHFLLLDLRQ